jgi:hypothetical protein
MSDDTKGFAVSTWAVNNRKTVFLIIAIIFFGGMIAYQNMPKENFPELQYELEWGSGGRNPLLGHGEN